MNSDKKVSFPFDLSIVNFLALLLFLLINNKIQQQIIIIIAIANKNDNKNKEGWLRVYRNKEKNQNALNYADYF